MTAPEAVFFAACNKIAPPVKTMSATWRAARDRPGIGQGSHPLSGDVAQRLKLALHRRTSVSAQKGSSIDDDAPGVLTVAPDWICAVLSDRTERVDRGIKMRIYRRLASSAGVSSGMRRPADPLVDRHALDPGGAGRGGDVVVVRLEQGRSDGRPRAPPRQPRRVLRLGGPGATRGQRGELEGHHILVGRRLKRDPALVFGSDEASPDFALLPP